MRYQDTILRKVRASDMLTLLEWRNSERIRRAMFSDDTISLEVHRNWFNEVLNGHRGLNFIFELEGKSVGYINFTGIVPRHQRCAWGFYLGSEDLPPGTGSAMAYLALSHLFQHNQIQKVTGEVLCTNSGSLAFHEKLGFHMEGQLKRHICKQGVFYDVVVFALFREDWEKEKPGQYLRIFGS